jgi:hypothetical protein
MDLLLRVNEAFCEVLDLLLELLDHSLVKLGDDCSLVQLLIDLLFLTNQVNFLRFFYPFDGLGALAGLRSLLNLLLIDLLLDPMGFSLFLSFYRGREDRFDSFTGPFGLSLLIREGHCGILGGGAGGPLLHRANVCLQDGSFLYHLGLRLSGGVPIGLLTLLHLARTLLHLLEALVNVSVERFLHMHGVYFPSQSLPDDVV